MKAYLDLLRHVLENGERRSDRTGTGTLSVFGQQLRFDLSQGFPLVTTKKCHLRSIIHELLWFVRGGTNIATLRENGVTIWDEWADAEGELGPVYGYQWRHWGRPWRPDGAPVVTEPDPATVAKSEAGAPLPVRGGGIDQLAQVISDIRTNPTSRRLIVSAWNVGDLGQMALAPCHMFFQFYVGSDGRLSCQMFQRSADVFLGVPFNIASYALLTMMVAQVTGLTPGDFVHTFGDVHLYLNHVEQARLQLTRDPRPLPVMTIDPSVRAIDDFRYGHFALTGYDPHPAIKAPIAV